MNQFRPGQPGQPGQSTVADQIEMLEAHKVGLEITLKQLELKQNLAQVQRDSCDTIRDATGLLYPEKEVNIPAPLKAFLSSYALVMYAQAALSQFEIGQQRAQINSQMEIINSQLQMLKSPISIAAPNTMNLLNKTTRTGFGKA